MIINLKELWHKIADKLTFDGDHWIWNGTYSYSRPVLRYYVGQKRVHHRVRKLLCKICDIKDFNSTCKRAECVNPRHTDNRG
jgi:hypothetical protein